MMTRTLCPAPAEGIVEVVAGGTVVDVVDVVDPAVVVDDRSGPDAVVVHPARSTTAEEARSSLRIRIATPSHRIDAVARHRPVTPAVPAR
jgi:hypothetical protein